MMEQNNWQPIATAPMDGIDILAKWEDDPDYRPSTVKYDSERRSWFIYAGKMTFPCIPPSHWSPIN